MSYFEKSLGRNVRFLLPSLKLKQPSKDGRTVEQVVHRYLVENFGGYTATSANLFGFWKDKEGGESYGEHREFVVALENDGQLPQLKEFLSWVAGEMQEECLYLDVAGKASLLYGKHEVQV